MYEINMQCLKALLDVISARVFWQTFSFPYVARRFDGLCILQKRETAAPTTIKNRSLSFPVRSKKKKEHSPKALSRQPVALPAHLFKFLLRCTLLLINGTARKMKRESEKTKTTVRLFLHNTSAEENHFLQRPSWVTLRHSTLYGPSDYRYRC